LTEMGAIMARQRDAFDVARPEPLLVRRDRLERCAALLREHGEALATAMSADFGHRSREQSLVGDVMPALSAVRHAVRNLKRWARPERRR